MYYTDFNLSDVLNLRSELNITQHDFANAFGISKTTLQRIEVGVSKDINTIKLLELILTFPEVALWQLKQTGCSVHDDVLNKLTKYFECYEK